MDTIDKRRRQDFEDLQNEIAGRETGRMARFGVSAAREHARKEERRKERAYRDALDRLLQTDAEYRVLYDDLGAKLSSAESDADGRIETLRADLSAAQANNQTMLDRAAKLPGGTAVFRYEDGRVVDADDNEISPESAQGIQWPPDAPSAEEYFAGKEQELALKTRLEDWLGYRTGTLGDIRDRYDDRDAPMDKDGLREALEEIEAARPKETSLETHAARGAVPPADPQAFPSFN
ncbi:MAG: hypothetical protein AB8B85_08420 [Paracoccaceae bacterium]